MADQVIENLITKLSFDFDDKQLAKFDDLVKSGVKSLVAIVAGATAAAGAIFAFTKTIAESNDQLNRLSQTLGVDIESLQELGFVAELNKGSIESMNSSLGNLSKITSEAARGIGAGVEVFGMLGLSATDSAGQIKAADEMMLEIADSIAKLGTQAERLEFAEKLGINRDLLLTLQQGSDAILQQRKEARELGFVFDRNAAQSAEAFADELLRVNKVIQGVATAIGTDLMKEITPMMKSFVSWFKINKALIQQNLMSFLEGTIRAIRGVFGVVTRVVGVVLSLVDAMGGWENSIIAVTGLLIAMNASALLMPVLAIAAGAAILLLLEDIIKFAEGGDSAVGDLAKRFPEFDALLRTTLDLVKMVRDGWILIFTEGDAALEGMILMAQDFGNAIKEYVMLPINKVSSLIEKIPNISEINIPIISDLINPGGDGETSPQEKDGIIKRLFDFKLPDIPDFSLPKINDFNFRSPINETVTRLGSQSNINNQSNSNTNNVTNNFTINGNNQEEMKSIVVGVLNEQYSSAETNLSTQVEN